MGNIRGCAVEGTPDGSNMWEASNSILDDRGEDSVWGPAGAICGLAGLLGCAIDRLSLRRSGFAECGNVGVEELRKGKGIVT